MSSTDIAALIAALERRDTLSADEHAALAALSWRERTFAADECIIQAQSRPTESCLLLDGIAVRSDLLNDGRRQISAIHVVGDFLDLHGLLLRVMDHSVTALTPCRVAFVEHGAVKRLADEHSHLGRLLFTLIAIDAAIQRSWIVCLGRRNPVRHLAHLVCELYLRFDVVGRVQDGGFDFPATQEELSDMLGLSVVHTNRTVQQLRATGLVSWRNPRIDVVDWNGLKTLADFDPTYLSLVEERR